MIPGPALDDLIQRTIDAWTPGAALDHIDVAFLTPIPTGAQWSDKKVLAYMVQRDLARSSGGEGSRIFHKHILTPQAEAMRSTKALP